MTSIEIVFNNFEKIAQQYVREADALCEMTANGIVGHARIAIQGPPKSGRIYKHGNISHQASAPGEAPATDTGALAANSLVKRIGTCDFEVQFNQEYAAPLEFGAPRVLPRPFLRPAVEAHRKFFFDGIAKLMGKV